MEIPDDITMCWVCGALHLDPDNKCPDCGAGLYHQINGEGKNGENLKTRLFAAKAYSEEAKRIRKHADELDAFADQLCNLDATGE